MKVHLRRKQQKERAALYLDFFLNKKRVKEYLDISIFTGRITPEQKLHNREKLKLAETIRAKREEELEFTSHGYVPKFKRESNFVEYFGALVKEKYKGWIPPHKHLQDYTKGKVSFKQVTTPWLEGFQKYLAEQVSPNTANTYFNKIRAALNIALRDRIITFNPSRGIKPLKVGKVKRPFLTFEELQQLSQTPCSDTEVKRAFLFACYTGLRLSDVLRLTWSNIHGETLEVVVKKTGDPFTLKLHPQALKIIGSPKNQESALFHLPPPEEDWKIWKALQDWGERSGLQKKISFHVSRRTFATLALQETEDIYTVSKLLGHTEVRNTQLYVTLLGKKKDEAINRLPSLEDSND